MAKKLYRAEVTTTYYFVAEEGHEEKVAEKTMKEAIKDDFDLSPDVNEVTSFGLALDWSDEELLVYGDTDGDMTLREAFDALTGMNYEEEEKKFKDRFKSKA